MLTGKLTPRLGGIEANLNRVTSLGSRLKFIFQLISTIDPATANINVNVGNILI